jgi:hypothetical protein
MGFEQAGDLGFERVQLAGTGAGLSLAEALAGEPLCDRARIHREFFRNLMGAQAFVIFEVAEFVI